MRLWILRQMFFVSALCFLLAACGSDENGSVDGDLEVEQELIETDGDPELEAELEIEEDGDLDLTEWDEDLPEQETEEEAEPEIEEEVEISYCHQDPCAHHANCTDTVNGAECVCVPGYTGDGFESCEDINECELGTSSCDPITECINGGGGFTCGNCPEDYTGNSASGCVPITTSHLRTFALASSDNTISVYSNFPFEVESDEISEIMVFIPEKGADTEQYYLDVYDLARRGKATGRTFIIVPVFLLASDTPAAKEIFWQTANDWLFGNQTPAQETLDISSYTVVDQLILSLVSEKLPNLKNAIIAGHASAADFVQRYAAGTKIEDSLDFDVRYIVANANSYLYLTNERKIADSFAAPTGDCSNFNDYHYGLTGMNPYYNLAGESYISSRYALKEVYYIAGRTNTASDDAGFDSSCSANLQGENRMSRAENFKSYTDYYGGTEIHNLILVDEVGHDMEGIFTDPAVKEAAFNVWVE